MDVEKRPFFILCGVGTSLRRIFFLHISGRHEPHAKNYQSQTIRNNHLIKEKMNLKKIYFTYLNIMSMQ